MRTEREVRYLYVVSVRRVKGVATQSYGNHYHQGFGGGGAGTVVRILEQLQHILDINYNTEGERESSEDRYGVHT